MKPQYQSLLDAGYRAITYSGDSDMAVNFLGSEWFVDSLNRKETVKYRKWTHENQVAGYVHQYEGITYCTIKVSYNTD